MQNRIFASLHSKIQLHPPENNIDECRWAHFCTIGIHFLNAEIACRGTSVRAAFDFYIVFTGTE